MRAVPQANCTCDYLAHTLVQWATKQLAKNRAKTRALAISVAQGEEN
jgi:hypothetical protein